jgi:hypothetical protein
MEDHVSSSLGYLVESSPDAASVSPFQPPLPCCPSEDALSVLEAPSLPEARIDSLSDISEEVPEEDKI